MRTCQVNCNTKALDTTDPTSWPTVHPPVLRSTVDISRSCSGKTSLRFCRLPPERQEPKLLKASTKFGGHLDGSSPRRKASVPIGSYRCDASGDASKHPADRCALCFPRLTAPNWMALKMPRTGPACTTHNTALKSHEALTHCRSKQITHRRLSGQTLHCSMPTMHLTTVASKRKS